MFTSSLKSFRTRPKSPSQKVEHVTTSENRFLVAKLFGAISPNISSNNVITHVAIQTASQASIHDFTARSVAITVASAAVNVFTRLFPMRIVIRSLSFFSFIYLRSFDQNFPSFTRASILCDGRLINANSVHEKNHDNKNKTTNIIMVMGSTILY